MGVGHTIEGQVHGVARGVGEGRAIGGETGDGDTIAVVVADVGVDEHALVGAGATPAEGQIALGIDTALRHRLGLLEGHLLVDLGDAGLLGLFTLLASKRLVDVLGDLFLLSLDLLMNGDPGRAIRHARHDEHGDDSDDDLLHGGSIVLGASLVC